MIEPILFSYKAYNTNEVVVKGKVHAYSRSEVIRLLQDMELEPISITSSSRFVAKIKLFLYRLIPGQRISKRSIAALLKRLAEGLEKNIQLDEAILQFLRSSSSLQLNYILYYIYSDVKQGILFSSSLAAHGKKIVTKDEVALIHIAEEVGQLALALFSLAQNKAKSSSNFVSLITQSIYLWGIVAASYIMSNRIAKATWAEMSDLAVITGREMKASEHLYYAFFGYDLTGTLTIVLGLIIFSAAYLTMHKHFSHVRRANDWLITKLPVIKSLSQKRTQAQFYRVLVLGLSANIPIDQIMKIGINVIKNNHFKDQYKKAYLFLENGGDIATFLKLVPFLTTTDQLYIANAIESNDKVASSEELTRYSDTLMDLFLASFSAFVRLTALALLFTIITLNIRYAVDVWHRVG